MFENIVSLDSVRLSDSEGMFLRFYGVIFQFVTAL